jgi:hypothetical protein
MIFPHEKFEPLVDFELPIFFPINCVEGVVAL